MPNLILIENDYPDSKSLLNVVNYALRSGDMGGYAIDPGCAYRQMMMVKNAWHKTEGTQLKHFIISFTTAEAYHLTMDEMLSVGFFAAKQFKSYQVAYALHSDTDHFHLHLVMNTVSYEDGHRYADGRAGFWKLQNELQMIFPKSDVGLYTSYPLSSVNKYLDADANNVFLRIG